MDGYTVVYSPSGILQSNANRGVKTISNMDASHEPNADPKKPDARVHTMWFHLSKYQKEAELTRGILCEYSR